MPKTKNPYPFSRTPDVAHPPFLWSVGTSTFSGTIDPVSYWGFNILNGGQKVNSAEPYAAFVIEADYNDGAQRTMEQYFELNSTTGVNFRPLFVQVKRDASTPETFITEVSLSGNPVILQSADNSATGSFGGYGQRPTSVTAKCGLNYFTLYAPKTTANTQLQIKAATSRAAVIEMGYGGTDAAMVIQTEATTLLSIYQAGSTGVAKFYKVTGGGAASFGASPYDNTAGVLSAQASTSQKAFVARAIASSAADLFQFQASDGTTIYSRFNKAGYFMTRKAAAPADADLVASEAAIWLDDTNAAGKLMIKAKTANGTVVTGSVTLA